MSEKRGKAAAYCGLYCEDCSFHLGTIPDLARDLRKELRRVRFDKVSEVVSFVDAEDYRRTYEILGSLVRLRCGSCKVSGRSRFCRIAQCEVKMGYEGRWECPESAACQ